MVLLPVKAVGVMGDSRTYESVVSLRAVTSRDGMTADWYPFKAEDLGRIANRIINQVPGINRVVYDVSSESLPPRLSGNDCFSFVPYSAPETMPLSFSV